MPARTEQTVGDWVPKVTARPDDADADRGTGVLPNNWVPGFANAIAWPACPAAVSVNVWVPLGLTPFCAVIVITYGPPTGGVPVSNPVTEARFTPDGNPVAENVGAGVPAAVTVKVFDPVVENVALFADVITGALLRFNVNVAVSGASDGTVVAPHVPSASTAALEALFKLIT